MAPPTVDILAAIAAGHRMLVDEGHGYPYL